jgi:hypothetical protein
MAGGRRGANTIAEVLSELDAVLDRALDEGSRVGYFAAIYRKVTAKVAEGIATGFFDDAERMERLDVVFARRYLSALESFQNGRPSTRSWDLAFEATRQRRPIVLQHLLAGINAHINLDLGIAAASTAGGAALPELRRDFDRINEILATLIAGIEHDLAEISPWIGMLDWIGGRHDEELIRFSVEIARTGAWRFATELAPLDEAHWSGPIGARDARVAHVATRVLRPGLLTVGLMVIRSRERHEVRRTIEILNGVEAPALPVVEARVRQLRASTP